MNALKILEIVFIKLNYNEMSITQGTMNVISRLCNNVMFPLLGWLGELARGDS